MTTDNITFDNITFDTITLHIKIEACRILLKFTKEVDLFSKQDKEVKCLKVIHYNQCSS